MKSPYLHNDKALIHYVSLAKEMRTSWKPEIKIKYEQYVF